MYTNLVNINNKKLHNTLETNKIARLDTLLVKIPSNVGDMHEFSHVGALSQHPFLQRKGGKEGSHITKIPGGGRRNAMRGGLR